MVSDELVRRFAQIALSPDPDLAVAALTIARLEYPKIDIARYLGELDRMGNEAALRVSATRAGSQVAPAHVDPEAFAKLTALNDYLFGEQRFVGNDLEYEDPRNSFLNQVLERRTGIPITLALVYIEVARRAGLRLEGINFPGHFLVRCPVRAGRQFSRDLIIDAFHGGSFLSEEACRELLRKHAGQEETWGPHLLEQATKPQILARMLLNLKRVYVGMYSFPQARDITELLLAVDPTATSELRDRGLLAYQLNDLSAALRDLQTYLQLSPKTELDDDDRQEREQIWEHVKSIKRRVASFN
jgi:regulator of sirC expression with transglutaminase-like and TPR domain